MLTKAGKSQYEVVGHCPSCGAPVYAVPSDNGGVPQSKHSCDCRNAKTGSNGGKMTKYGK